MLDKLLEQVFGHGGSLIHDLREALRDVVKLLPPLGPDVVAVLTYGQAIEYFVRNCPPHPSVGKGVLMRQPHPQGFLVIQVFLDRRNNIVRRRDGRVYGRQLIAEQFDPELNDIFGDKDLILVE